MRVVIAGAGAVGRSVAQELIDNGNGAERQVAVLVMIAPAVTAAAVPAALLP